MVLNVNFKKLTHITIYLYCLIIGIKINANEDGHKNIKWEKIRSNNIKDIDESIKWKKIDEKNNKDYISNKNKNNQESSNSNHNMLQLGKSVPSANTLFKGDLRLETSHVSTFDGGISGGIGNQNYSGLIQYGLNDYITISSFYTEADDPLYSKIDAFESQPENLWSNYGIGLRWNIVSKNNYKLSIDSSIERWRVGSGGCFGYNCKNTSNNIFNLERSKVTNDNTIGSISTPITWKRIKDLNITLSPRLTFLPIKQTHRYGRSEFYGINYGFGLGGSFDINNKARIFTSSYLPIIGNNSIDENLKYKKNIIYTVGLNHKIDSKIALEGYLTNSFGQTPATSVLTLPTSNELIYGGRLIYTPTNKEEHKENTKEISNNLKTNTGITVNTTKILKTGQKSLVAILDKSGSTFYKVKLGFSDKFTFDIGTSKINKTYNSNNKYKNTYLTPDYESVRGGGTVILLAEEDGNYLTTGLRLSYGRLLAESRPGYLFSELVNSYSVNDSFIVNLNPKMASTADGTLISIGGNINYKITPTLIVIPETNISIKNTQTNVSVIVKKIISPSLNINIYATNSLSSMDMGQMLKHDEYYYGLKLAYRF